MTYPIILPDGFFPFDKIWCDSLDIDTNDDPKLYNWHYFKGIRAMLKKNGFVVYRSSVRWAADMNTRAEGLKKNILYILGKQNCQKVNIIAHIMDSLDASHMLFNDQKLPLIHEKKTSIPTISTPRQGSPFAYWGINNIPHVIPLAHKLGIDLNAFKDLRTGLLRKFNSNTDAINFENWRNKNFISTVCGEEENDRTHSQNLISCTR